MVRKGRRPAARQEASALGGIVSQAVAKLSVHAAPEYLENTAAARAEFKERYATQYWRLKEASRNLQALIHSLPDEGARRVARTMAQIITNTPSTP